MEKWAELRTAYQVAKLGTVSAAAKALGFHRATVNRHIDALESELGSRVFIRHARGYELTELGKEVLRTAQKTEQLLDDLAGLAMVKQVQIEGDIKLTTIALCYAWGLNPLTLIISCRPLKRFTSICMLIIATYKNMACPRGLMTWPTTSLLCHHLIGPLGFLKNGLTPMLKRNKWLYMWITYP